MSQAYSTAGDLLKSAPELEAAPLPPEVAELAVFVRRARSLGNQVAFWRSKANLSLLKSATQAMRAVLLSATWDSTDDPPNPALLGAYKELLVNLNAIVESIPFSSRVGVLRRSLIDTFQQVFVLRHLCQAIVCRLRMALQESDAPSPAGSLLDADTKRAHRAAFQSVAGGWDNQRWNAYDYL
ncbi:MAG: hypothetical protein KIT83_10880 [Bryobacterales bacterium]|nr:hypothetical protein [Bryobacterales bacterium]